jgi:hypothetical protein
MASIIRQLSYFSGQLVASFWRDSKASLMNPGSHSKILDHFLIRDGCGNGRIDLTY